MPELIVTADLIQELWMSATHGIPVGATLDIPTNYCALIVRNGNALYVLDPDHYLFLPENFPLLKLRRVAKSAPMMLEAALYLIRTEEISLVWEQPLIRKARWNEGATYESLKGEYHICIVDPVKFFETTYDRLKAIGQKAPAKSFQLARPEANGMEFAVANIVPEANRFVSPLLESALLAMQRKLSRKKEGVTSQRETVQTEIGSLIAPKLSEYGAQLLSFTIDSASAPISVPCQCCGNSKRPTGNVVFCANVSLLVVRYEWVRPGYFCALCAFKYFLGYTALTLVLGWWGLIGLIFSLIFIVLNIVNMGRALLRYRRPLLPELLETD